jgi:hypothetical protein
MPPKKSIIKPTNYIRANPNDLIKKLEDRKRFTLVVKEHYIKLPIQTHIGYVYRDRNNELIPVISAFVQQHYIAITGEPGMLVKSGARTYPNFYSTMEKVYIYNTDVKAIASQVAHDEKYNKQPNSTAELETKIKKLEEVLTSVVHKLARSTSIINMKQSAKMNEPPPPPPKGMKDTITSLKTQPAKPTKPTKHTKPTNKRPSSITHGKKGEQINFN